MTVKNTTDDLATTLREAREWDRRFLAGERPLVESRRLNPPAPPPQVQAIIEAVERDLTDAPRPPAAPRPVPASASTRAPVE
jgi:hypothetical protein